MRTLGPLPKSSLDRATEFVRKSDLSPRLSGLVFDVLGSQAEGGRPSGGDEDLQRWLEKHKLGSDDTITPLGDVSEALRGAVYGSGALQDDLRALVSALLVLGFDHACDAEPAQLDATVRAFARHADGLSLHSPYRPLAFVDSLLAPPRAGLVWRAFAKCALDARAADDEVSFAEQALRLHVLAGARGEGARVLRKRVADALEAPALRQLAAELFRDPHADERTYALSGELGRSPRRAGWELVRWLSGWAVAYWLLRALARVVGLRFSAQAELSPKQLSLGTRTLLLGRTVRESEEIVPLSAVEGATRSVRFPMLHLMVGVLALALGVLVGGLTAVDGVRSGDTAALMLGAGLLLAGVALDLVLGVLVPGGRGRVAFTLRLRNRGAVRLTHVPLKDAEALLRALSERFKTQA